LRIAEDTHVDVAVDGVVGTTTRDVNVVGTMNAFIIIIVSDGDIATAMAMAAAHCIFIFFITT